MAFFLSPILNEQQFDANGAPRAGALISTYLAGTLTATTTYKTSTGTAHTNPIQLDSSGNYPNGTQLWLLGGFAYKFVITDSDGANSRTYDNITGVGDDLSGIDQWIVFAGTPTYISATSFSVSGDQTNIFQISRRIRTINTGGTVYSTISNSVFGAGITTVTVVNDSGVLDSGLSQVSYGLLTPLNPSVPTTYAKSGANSDITSLNGLTTKIRGTFLGITRYSTAGSGTYTKSAGAVSALIRAIGGGGGGATGSGGSVVAGGGGGAGGFAELYIASLAGPYSYTVGAGGTAAVAGVATTIAGISATGGAASPGVAGGAGGTPTGGDINIRGGNGTSGDTGEAGVTNGSGGAGGNGYFGGGGGGGAGTTAGTAGVFGGGGGGGGGSGGVGGTGGAGYIEITEYY